MCRQLNSPVNLSANAGHFGGTSNIAIHFAVVWPYIFSLKQNRIRSFLAKSRRFFSFSFFLLHFR